MTFYTLLLFVILHLALLPLFIFILSKFSTKAALAFLGFVVIESVAVAFYTVLNFGGAFGLGIVFFFASCLGIPLSLLFFAFGKKKFTNTPQARLYLVGALLIIAAQFAPIFGVYGLGRFCDGRTRQTGRPLIVALQKYQQEQGHYPAQPADLVPVYLPALPTARCLMAFGPQAEFKLTDCGTEGVLLTSRSFDGSQILRYNFSTNRWSRISFLDGACSFLQ